MKTSFNGLLSLIGAILVFTTVSVCFSNCSSEDDFGEMEEMIATMAEKKMTRATESVFLDSYTKNIEFFANKYEMVLDTILSPWDDDDEIEDPWGDDGFLDENQGDNTMIGKETLLCTYKVDFSLYSNNGTPYCVIDRVEHASNYDVAFEAGTTTSDGYYLYFSTIYNGHTGIGRTHVTR
jgi:hypothetical protein